MTTLTSVGALLAKDLRTVRIGILIGLPVVLLQGMTFLMRGTSAYVLYLAGATLALSLSGTVVDHRYRTESLLASLPVTRGRLVAARYLWCALTVAVMLGLAIAEARVLAEAGVGAARALDGPDVLPFLAVTVVVPSIFLPFHYRWGLGGGLARFSLTSVGLLLLGGAAGLLSRRRGVDLAARARSLLATTIAALGPTATVLATAALLAALGALSCLLSMRLYDRREL